MKRDQAAWDKQTIEMVDALLTHGLILRTRLNAEYRRLKRLPDDQWDWLSERESRKLSLIFATTPSSLTCYIRETMWR